MLEVGTGCGYQTAVLSLLSDEVYTVERISSLVAKARRNLRTLKLANIRIKHGDGSMALGEDLHVDGILITAAAREVPTALLTYLDTGGRMRRAKDRASRSAASIQDVKRDSRVSTSRPGGSAAHSRSIAPLPPAPSNCLVNQPAPRATAFHAMRC